MLEDPVFLSWSKTNVCQELSSGGCSASIMNDFAHWPFFACLLVVIVYVSLAIKFVRQYEGPGRPRGRMQDPYMGVWAIGDLDGGELWKCCWGALHPGWLFGFRLVAFCYFLPQVLYNFYMEGFWMFYFYTQYVARTLERPIRAKISFLTLNFLPKVVSTQSFRHIFKVLAGLADIFESSRLLLLLEGCGNFIFIIVQDLSIVWIVRPYVKVKKLRRACKWLIFRFGCLQVDFHSSYRIFWGRSESFYSQNRLCWTSLLDRIPEILVCKYPIWDADVVSWFALL